MQLTCLQELRRRKSSSLWQLRTLCLRLFNWLRSSSSELLLWALTTQKLRSVLTDTNNSWFEDITLTVVGLHYPYFRDSANCVACTLSEFSASTSLCYSTSSKTKKRIKLQIEEYAVTEYGQSGRSLEKLCVFLSPSQLIEVDIKKHQYFWQHASVLHILRIVVGAPI